MLWVCLFTGSTSRLKSECTGFYVDASKKPSHICVREQWVLVLRVLVRLFILKGWVQDGICFFMEKYFKRRNIIQMIMKILCPENGVQSANYQ